MKRSEVVELIASWAKEEILDHVYYRNYEEWADNLLYTLEHEIGMLPPTRYYEGDYPPLTLEMPFKSNTWEPEQFKDDNLEEALETNGSKD